MDTEHKEQDVWRRLREQLRPWRQRTTLAARQAARQAGPVLRAFWQAAKPVLRTTLQIVLALLILLEEWGWRPLADLLGRLARWQPWAQLESGIARLPPYAALFVFALPTAVLLPLKFLALFLIANGRLILAAILFAVAKVVATALVARLFVLTQPALMQIGWFAWCYDRFMPWKEVLVSYVRNSWVWRTGRLWKERARRAWVAQWRSWRPTLAKLQSAMRAAATELAGQVRRLVHELRARRAAREQ
jgi:hypothetical protein